MGKKYIIRVVRVDDFLAESLEAEANKMPPSKKEDADLLREEAQLYRKSANQKTIRLWEEVP